MATRVTVNRTIDASAETIFEAVSDVATLPNRDPDVLGVEVLSDVKSGVGTRFRETRRMGKRQMLTELEVTEYEPPARVRMVADSHGTVWDTVFTVESTGERATLTITMDARAHKLLPKLLNPVLKGMFRKGMEKHIDTVKAYCERQETATPG